MIYISSACVKHHKIADSVIELAENGFTHIELSGGTNYYPQILDDLLDLKNKYDLHYYIHNYFPPPKEHFVLNLASLDINVYNNTLDHFKNSVDLARELNIDKIGIHAGFYRDINLDTIGKDIDIKVMNNQNDAIDKFIEGYGALREYAKGIKIYIENNVVSYNNYQRMKQDPFMLTTYNDYLELKKRISFTILLDIAHLYVSTHTLGISFNDQLDHLLPETDYIHISANDGSKDENKLMSSEHEIINELKKYNFKNKIITLEIYEKMEFLKKSYEVIKNLIKA